ncbi:MAG: methylated-DNA--[protein]-cysteine S-methyltransferase [Myxococcota bacterium]|nr:methylated-DNA--[protein]-cysteine S-methyltransferase [Myxococcota bacterium]
MAFVQTPVSEDVAAPSAAAPAVRLVAGAEPAPVLYTAEFDSDFGRLRCASSDQGLVYVELPRASGRGFAGWCKRFAPEAELTPSAERNRAAATQIGEYLAGRREAFDLALDLRATPFQTRVYRALLTIPFGETRSYAQIAEQIGAPRAVRAVGTANGANPLAPVIPCHRVINTGGKLGGYGGGLDMKRRLLAMEHSRPAQGDLL